MSETVLFIVGALGGYLLYKQHIQQKNRERKQGKLEQQKTNQKPKQLARLVVQLKSLSKPIADILVELRNHEIIQRKPNPAGLLSFNVPVGKYTLIIKTIPEKKYTVILNEPKTYYLTIEV